MTELKTLNIDDTEYQTRFTRKFAGRRPYVGEDPRKVTAYIPGVIQKIHVAPGQEVKRGSKLLVLEAMKMQNDLTASREGVIKAVHVGLGQMVPKGALLIELE